MQSIENYQAGTTSLNYDGREATVTVYIEDSTLHLTVTLEWNGQYDEVEIMHIEAQMFDDEDNQVDTSNLDIENLVIDIFEKQNIFGQAERDMAKAFHEAHQEG